MQDEPVVSHGQEVSGDVFREGFLGLEGCFRVVGKADALRHAEDVRIDGHHLALPQHRPQHVGRLAPHTRQALQLLQVIGYLASELLDEHTGSGREVLGLVVGVGDRADICVDLLR